MPANRKRTGFRGPSPDVGKATQFQPGQSGNPNGRPKKQPYQEAHELIATLKVADLQIPPDTLAKLGILPEESVAVAIAKVVVREALKGKIEAVKEAANRAEGSPRMRIEHSSDDEQPVHVRVSFVKPSRNGKR